jgi:hypothetical protein
VRLTYRYEVLVRYLNRTEIASGFANRILWTCVKRSKYLPEGGLADERALAKLDARLEKALRFAGQADEEVQRDDAAEGLRRERYADIARARPGLLGAVTSRAEAQVMRLALTYALLDRTGRIGRVHLEAAMEVWRYAFDSAHYIWASRTGFVEADRILAALLQEDRGLSRSEISAVFGRRALNPPPTGS